ncbi:MAG: DUF2339 domain-containing protein [Kofleriaceae bacterium]|nr:DUF2339 domain-containing protein [Kofleriaceae bacterium]
MATELTELTQVVDRLRERIAKLEAGKQRSPLTQRVACQEENVEEWVAGYGAARLGIISLVTGVAFLIADSYSWLGAPLKVLLGYFIAAAFITIGRRFIKRPAALSQVLIAGGLGIAYYTTYAMHYVPSAKLIQSPVLALFLLAVMVLLIIFVSHRMQSETVAGVALFLGLHTGMVSPIGSFTLLSSVLLAAGAAFFLAKNRWVYVPISTLLAVYATHLLWILGNPMISPESTHELEHLSTSIAFATLYFATFSIALVFAAQNLKRSASLVFASLNWAALVAILVFEFHSHEAAGLAIALGTLSLSLALLALATGFLRPGSAVTEIHLVLAAMTLGLAAWVASSGVTQVVLAWSLTSLLTLGLAWLLRMQILAKVSSAILLLAYLAELQELQQLPLAASLALFTLVHYRLERALRSSEQVRVSGDYRHATALAWLAVSGIATGAAANLVVILWLACAVALFLLGLALREFSFRMAAMGIFILSFARLFLIDMAEIASGYRISAFIGLGAILLAVSFVNAKRSSSKG